MLFYVPFCINSTDLEVVESVKVKRLLMSAQLQKRDKSVGKYCISKVPVSTLELMIAYQLTTRHCYNITSCADEIIKTKLRITTKMFSLTHE